MDDGFKLRITTFGGLCIEQAHGGAVCLQTDRTRALFLYLLNHRNHMVHREAICATLWPDLGERQARAQLSKSLWRLRSALDPDPVPEQTAVVGQSESLIGLRADRIDADCWRLADAVTAIEFKDDQDLTLADAQKLSEVVRECQGTFCVGFFDDWCEHYRELNGQLVLDAMSRLVGYHQVRSNWAMAISWGRRAVQIDPLREDLHLAIMSGYRAMGNRASAMHQYHNCEQILANEMQVAPSDEMRSLYQDLAH